MVPAGLLHMGVGTEWVQITLLLPRKAVHSWANAQSLGIWGVKHQSMPGELSQKTLVVEQEVNI